MKNKKKCWPFLPSATGWDEIGIVDGIVLSFSSGPAGNFSGKFWGILSARDADSRFGPISAAHSLAPHSNLSPNHTHIIVVTTPKIYYERIRGSNLEIIKSAIILTFSNLNFQRPPGMILSATLALTFGRLPYLWIKWQDLGVFLLFAEYNDNQDVYKRMRYMFCFFTTIS